MRIRLHPRLEELQLKVSRSPSIRIVDAEIAIKELELWIKRDDLLHPVISGNKWRKLKYILNHALYLGVSRIISMGGVHSNHLHALAFAGKSLGLKTAAFVRGEPPIGSSPTLLDVQAWGMETRFISRNEYRQLRQFKTHDSLPFLKPGDYWLPEGGATDLALLGVAESVAEIDSGFDVLAVACGTGATMAGLIANTPATTKILGIAALKGAGFLYDDIRRLLIGQDHVHDNWEIALDFHGGGFAKVNPELRDFIREFEAKHNTPLEPIYTGKTMMAVYGLIRQGYFAKGQRILVFHTGGLQGKRVDRL